MAASMSSSGSTSATQYNVKNIFDGDTEDTGATGMAWSGDNKVDPWIELDLGEIQQVYEVRVYDRGDLGTRTTPLGFFEVALSNAPYPDSDNVRSGYPPPFGRIPSPRSVGMDLAPSASAGGVQLPHRREPRRDSGHPHLAVVPRLCALRRRDAAGLGPQSCAARDRRLCRREC